MTLNTNCRRYRWLERKEGDSRSPHFCQVQADIIGSCQENCPYNKPIQYKEVIVKDRWGAEHKFNRRCEE